MITITPSLEELESALQELKALLNHPEFQKAAEDVLSAPSEQRGQAFSAQLTPAALAPKGVPISDRISISLPASDTADTAGLPASNAPERKMVETANAGPFSDPDCPDGLAIRVANMVVCLTVPFRRRIPSITIQ